MRSTEHPMRSAAGIGADLVAERARRGARPCTGRRASARRCTSSTAAVSRTVRVSTCRTTSPAHASPSSGPSDTRPRVGLSPNSPHALAGMRIEPPPSPACPNGTMPDATAAPLPPLDPPGER